MNTMEISTAELQLLELLEKGKSLAEASKELGIGDGVYSMLNALRDAGAVKVSETVDERISLGEEGRDYLGSGLPERRLINAGSANDGKIPMSQLAKAGLKNYEVSIALQWVKKKGWGEIDKGTIVLSDKGKRAVDEKGDDELTLHLLEKGEMPASKLPKDGLKMLRERGKLISIREVKSFDVTITPAGKNALKNPTVADHSKSIGALTHEILVNKSWKKNKFRPYGLKESEDEYPAKIHPLRIAEEKIRRIFMDMGFSEVRGDFVESSFWNFDALFQPQDHPARDLADTFYLEGHEHELPEHHKLVKEMHENGGDIESTGWRYEWDPKKAMQSILRTHTTVVSARKLTESKVPAKLFSIGRVFRNETLDYKHLAEFYQVEGIVVGEDVNFSNLLWYLKQFYNKLGFKKVRFRPAYFPYTEMSCEPEVYLEEKKEWVELGGSGIFRPEVVKPLLGVEVPVLAWGLSLERPLMMNMGLNDIRTFYKNDLDWLRKFRVNKVL
jgi:phenylalanyl-tRNA synthetase alpha chain